VQHIVCKERTKEHSEGIQCEVIYEEELPLLTYTKETREGQPLLTVETEVNGNSKSTNEL
jgi:hypothetical protein